MVTKWDKALAALIVSGAVPIIVHFTGLQVPVEYQITATAALTGFFTYLVPNKGVTQS